MKTVFHHHCHDPFPSLPCQSPPHCSGCFCQHTSVEALSPLSSEWATSAVRKPSSYLRLSRPHVWLTSTWITSSFCSSSNTLHQYNHQDESTPHPAQALTFSAKLPSSVDQALTPWSNKFGVWCEAGFKVNFFHIYIQYIRHYLFKRLSFFHRMLHTFVKKQSNIWLCGSISGLYSVPLINS